MRCAQLPVQSLMGIHFQGFSGVPLANRGSVQSVVGGQDYIFMYTLYIYNTYFIFLLSLQAAYMAHMASSEKPSYCTVSKEWNLGSEAQLTCPKYLYTLEITTTNFLHCANFVSPGGTGMSAHQNLWAIKFIRMRDQDGRKSLMAKLSPTPNFVK